VVARHNTSASSRNARKRDRSVRQRSARRERGAAKAPLFLLVSPIPQSAYGSMRDRKSNCSLASCPYQHATAVPAMARNSEKVAVAKKGNLNLIPVPLSRSPGISRPYTPWLVYHTVIHHVKTFLLPQIKSVPGAFISTVLVPLQTPCCPRLPWGRRQAPATTHPNDRDGGSSGRDDGESPF